MAAQIYYSLIIPHYNIPQLLERLLRTIPEREDLQVIVVDDCSPTEIQVQLRRLQKIFPGIEFYSTGSNGGGGKARNIGLEHALGKYVLFADADDYFTPGISNILDEGHKKDCDLIFFQAISLDSESYQLSDRGNELNYWIKLCEKKHERGCKKLRYVFGEPWCKLIKHSTIRNHSIKFDETSCHNDTRFSYLVGHYSATVSIIPIVGYVVSFRVNSVIQTNFSNRYQIVADVFCEKERFFLINHIKEQCSALYVPLVLDLFHGKFNDFSIKYRFLRQKKGKFSIVMMIGLYFVKVSLYKLTGKKYFGLIH